MDWLIDNPIGHMYGPTFLLFYLIVIILTMIICRMKLKASDETKDMAPLLLPANPDIYEIAYLRGGENEVARVVIFDLIDRGYLKINGDSIEKNSAHPDPRFLQPAEKGIFESFSVSQKAGDIFNSSASHTLSYVKSYCEKLAEQLQIKHLITPMELKIQGWRIWLMGAAVIAGLGLYKGIVATITSHHNIAFSIIMGIISLVILVFVCQPPRLSARGRDYLARLQQAFTQFKNKATLDAASNKQSDQRVPTLALAVFGTSVLAGTSYSYFSTAFHRSSSSSGGGCGSCGSSGSSCGSGGGCGGGGCGGGGCGGCGG